MAHKKIKVPIIAITPEAEEDDDHNYSTLADALTDVETLEFDHETKNQPIDKSRYKLKIKLTDQEGAITDTEDIEGSGDEIEQKIVPYDKPISIDDLDLDPDVCKETHKIRSRNSQGKKKLHTQSSTVTEANTQLNLDSSNVNDGTTDVEDYIASDDDLKTIKESLVPDQMLEASITTQISDKFKKGIPLALDSDDDFQGRRLTDVEKLESGSNSEDDHKITQKKKIKRRRQKHNSEWSAKPVIHVHPYDSDEGNGYHQSFKATNRSKLVMKRKDSDDSDASNTNGACYNIKFGQSLPMPKTNQDGLTDVEILDSNDEHDEIEIPVAIVKKIKKGNSTDEEVLSDIDASYQIETVPDAPLPKAFRKLITVRDTRNKPIVTITPIEDNYKSELRFDHGMELTDEENFSDTDALLFAEALSRGPTPELSIFDGGFDDVSERIRLRRRRSLRPISPAIMEALTDTEDIVVSAGKKGNKYLSALTIARGEEHPGTDTEDLFLSDHWMDERRRNSDYGTDLESLLMSDDEYLNEKVDLLRALSTTPICMREMGGDTVLSKEGSGPFTDKNRLSINRRVPFTRNLITSPVLTDTEDLCVSDDDGDAQLRKDLPTPLGLRKELEESLSSSIFNQNTHKVDLDAPQEVMYLKGGSFREVCTDTEDVNVSDDEYHACFNKKKFSVDILSDNNVLVSMRKTCANLKDCPGPFRFKNEWDATGKPSDGGPIYTKGKPAVDADKKDVGEEGSEVPTQGPSSHSSQRFVTDQHQLSEEMKQLLRGMEEESKK